MSSTETVPPSATEVAFDKVGRTRPTSAPSRFGQTAHDKSSLTRVQMAVLLIMTGSILLAVYLLRLDPVVGMFKDDGWYLVLAKSLATGHGYNLINLPQHSGLYFYPPFFPFLLSLLYRLDPEFPRNVLLLKALSIFAALVLPILVFRLFARENRLPRHLLYLIAVASAVAPSCVMLATSSLMSEAVFTALQFAALLLAERVLQDKGDGVTPVVLLIGLLACSAYLTRTIGIAVVAAIALTFLQRKMFKAFAAVSALFVICAGSWALYTHSRAASGKEQIAAGYSAQFWDRLASAPGPKMTVRDLPGRVWQLSTVMIGDDIGALIVPSFYRFGAESGSEVIDMTMNIPAVSRNPMHTLPGSMGLAVAGQLISLGFSIVILIGFVAAARRGLGPTDLTFIFSLVIIVFWPWSPIRFLVPLLPLILYYLAMGVASIERTIQKLFSRAPIAADWRTARVVIVCVLSFFLYDHVSYIFAKHKDPGTLAYPRYLRSFNATRQAANWVREHTLPNEVIASSNIPMIYLYSDRMTAMCNLSECAKDGIRYFVNTEALEMPLYAKSVFKTGFGIEVFDIQNAPMSQNSSNSSKP